MKINSFAKRLAIAVSWLTNTMLCWSMIALSVYGIFFTNTSALAAPTVNLIASTDAGDQVQYKASEDAGGAKNFIRDTEEKVKETAKKNASRVADATDNDNSFVERKAKKDAALIQKRATEDSARTQKAVDNTKNAVEKAVDSIKDAFGK
jgi:hypothetical protein